MKFNCPNCRIEIEADASVGDVGDCPNCGREFRVAAPGVLQLTAPAPAARIRVPQHEPRGPRIRVPSSGGQVHERPVTESTATRSLPYEGSGMASSVLLWILNPLYGIVAVAIAGISSAYASVGDKERAVVFARAGKPVRLIGWIVTILAFVVIAACFVGG